GSSSTLTKELIKDAAEKCCTRNRQECCIEIMKFGTPIRCGYDRDPKLPGYVYKCLQNVLFAKEPKKKINLDDSVCCSVFGNDQEDSGRRCENRCKNLMTSPSIDAATRLDSIKSCSLLDNVLYKCFEKCRSLRKDGIKIEVLQFEEYCEATFIQKRTFRGV
uniref:Her-1 protein n=1 Tax=Caenorhabditis elegans TaxID=6239 RepID=UPI0000403C69|nr:Chain A, Her-1 protein [Caenorhabditis elegans]1SZH_B Chain B, Her-1 protein [Caenorhabditis elegans]